MCGKKSNHGLRLIVVSFVLLVLVLQPVSAAWPFFFGGQKTETSPTQSLQVQEGNTAQLEAEIQLLEQRNKELESKYNEALKQLDNLSKNLEKYGVRFGDSQATAESLLKEIGDLKETLDILSTSRAELESKHNQLILDYDAKVAESAGYFTQATDATAKYNALNDKRKNITTTIGMAGVMKEGKYGMDVTAGVNFGKVGVFGGAVYMFGQDDIFKPADLMYKAGLTLTF